MILPVWTAAAVEPPPAAWFEYTLTEAVSGTSGEYQGYFDATEANGRYELVPDGTTVKVHARYDWRYSSAEKNESGTVDRSTSFDPSTRRYAGAEIDLDDEEYARVPPGELATWLWVDPATPEGAKVRVLDLDCTLASRSDPVPRTSLRGLRVRCEGSGERHDDYGDMSYTFTEDYWYDLATGFVLAEDYTERDQGKIEGSPGRFTRRSGLQLREASYAPSALPDLPATLRPVDPTILSPAETLATGCVGLVGVGAWTAALFLAVFAGLMGLVWVARRGTRIPDVITGTSQGTVRVAPLVDALALAGLDASGCTTHFGPFVEDFADRARAAGDPVWTATAEDGRLAGMAWWDRDAEMGTVLCPDAKVAANLVRRLKTGEAVEFFSEHRHLVGGKPFYNLHERWVVLARRADEELAVDSGSVRRYQPADRPDVVALLQKEWGGGTSEVPAWLDRQVARGDPAFVALVDGRVVGFALAAVVGTNGRLALAIVDPARRDRGLGSELVRARLTALHRLGVERVVVEVADWNVAPLHLLRKLGFEDVGELFVESSSPTRRRRNVVRR